MEGYILQFYFQKKIISKEILFNDDCKRHTVQKQLLVWMTRIYN